MIAERYVVITPVTPEGMLKTLEYDNEVRIAYLKQNIRRATKLCIDPKTFIGELRALRRLRRDLWRYDKKAGTFRSCAEYRE